MRRPLFLTFVLVAAPAFGQGLGVSPALPDGVSALTVSPQAGPWMICVASFVDQPVRGQPEEHVARGQAEELASEIRTRYGLPAYVFNRTAEERRLEQERITREKAEWKKKLQMDGLDPETPIHAIKTVRIVDQYAVLVGGYKDDAAARKELDKIRKLKPSDKFATYAYGRDPKTGKVTEEAVNPFQSAFICHNPTVPNEKPKQDADLSKRLKEYNAGESFSLLKNPKPFTLVIKAYKGEAMVQSQAASKSMVELMGMKFGSVLNANGNEAHKVAEYLRNKQIGLDAYVLHTEYNSYVTIGGFDSAEDPRLEQVKLNYLKELGRPGSGLNQLHMKVQFLTDPMAMPVPQAK